MPFEVPLLALVLAGALVAGFTSGFAGFGTGLVASGLWFHALPASMVPPLVVLTSVAAQLVGVVAVRASFDWWQARPLLIGGFIGVPIGVSVLQWSSPGALKASVGLFLVSYVLIRFLFAASPPKVAVGGPGVDGAVGLGGGFLGGFAGLSGPLPLVWMQLKGGSPDAQRAVYQPFNLCVLSFAAAVMAWRGEIDAEVSWLAGACLPLTLAGAWLGMGAYRRVSERLFTRVILLTLLASGLVLAAQLFA